MRNSRVVVAIALLLLLACRPAPADDPSPEPASAKPAPSLADVAWLAGSWKGEWEGARQEEHWLPPAGGLMLGLHRDVLPGGKVSFEYLRIEQGHDGVTYQASPGGAPPTPFRLVEASPTRAVFTNPQHDFPQRILYTLSGASLTARIEGADGQGMEWTWTRAAFD